MPQTIPVSPDRNPAERGVGARLPTNFPAVVLLSKRSARCRAIELSNTGIVLEHAGGWSVHGTRKPMGLELRLGPNMLVRALVRPIRSRGRNAYAFKFVAISDVNRLLLVEYLDREELDFARLFEALRSDAKLLC